MTITQKYNQSLTEKWYMRFRTRHPDGDNYDGIITHIKRTFIILQEERDFELDGIIALPRRVIKGVRDGKYEQCGNQILRQNGSIKKLRAPGWLDACETIPQLLSAMMRRHIWPCIETLFNQGTESAFYLGPLTRIAEDSFYLNCYDAAGKWEKIYRLPYENVFKIEFDSKYCKHFNAYMKSAPPL